VDFELRIADLKSAAVILVDFDLLAAIETNPQFAIRNPQFCHPG
jgi:hypothetical protein